MKRRRFLTLAPAALASCRSTKDAVQTWRGIRMGIEVEVSWRGEADPDPALQEVREAESALTLWDHNSPISQLNRDGLLKNPPRHLLACLGKARELYETSEGLFDPTIHSYLEWARAEYQAGRVPEEALAEQKRQLVDFSKVNVSATEIAMPPGCALDLNGLAQGYLTDTFAESFGASSALINFGEYRVLGNGPWPVEVDGKSIPLTRALAVSSGSGERLSATSAANHLIHPGTGESPPPKKIFAVEADEAWLADGLATLVAVGGKIPPRFASRAVVRSS